MSLASAFQRVENTTLAFPEEIRTSGYSLTNAFGDLAFDQPVAAIAPPGETNRLFILEKTGRIMAITNLAQPNKTLFLDLTAGLHTNNVECGLLGLAFHPGYATNRYFYVYRTLYTSSPLAPNDLHDQLSRFETSPNNPAQALANSELPLIVQRDAAESHNAGDVQFGPDGYLYLSLGDEGPPPGELALTRQPIDKSFFGGILRIDVDKRAGNLPPNPHGASTPNYLIPADNPFIGVTNYQGITVDPNAVRTEFFAVGFRNPWRMSFDPETGLLYCADVGGGGFEEVNVVVSGGNYGWPYMEAFQEIPFITEAPSQFQSIPPIVNYTHGKATNQGLAIMGGIVYRGDAIPLLHGHYIFGDNITGHVWAKQYTEGDTSNSFDWLTSLPGISAFGRDPRNGDVLAVNFHDGKLYRLIYTPPEEAISFPETLAETGAFADLLSLAPHPGILPYEINVPFWSDNAIKSRWFSVPDLTRTIGFDTSGNWTFPNGTVWIKHFDMELTNGVPESRRRIETRFFVKNETGGYGVTYRWDDSQTNAVLVNAAGSNEEFNIYDNGNVRTQLWRYPSRPECMSCHSPAAGHALGFNTWQMNCAGPDSAENTNQIQRLSDLGYFTSAVSNLSVLPALAHATNVDYSVAFRARSYLAANCSQCHQPGGSYTMRAQWDGRITTRWDNTKLLPSLIKPNSPEHSGVMWRLMDQGSARMPAIGSTILDTNAIDLVREWIKSFPVAPWKNQDVGNPSREGNSAMGTNTFQVSGSGTGISGTSDQFQFLYQPFRGNGQITARYIGGLKSLTSAHAAIMFRENLSETSKYAATILHPGNSATYQVREENGEAASGTSIANTTGGPQWLKLVREGNVFTSFVSPDGTNWTDYEAETLELADEVLVGLAVSANNNAALSLATFDNVSLMSVEVQVPAGEFEAPVDIPIFAKIKASGNSIAKVEYFAGESKVSELTQKPFTFVWTNAPSGSHEIRVRVTDNSGAAVWSQAIPIQVTLPSGTATSIEWDGLDAGNWQGSFGSDGYTIAAYATNLPSYVDLTMSASADWIWNEETIDERALRKLDVDSGIASTWHAPESFTLDLKLLYGHFRRVSLYFLDWDGENQRAQAIEILDSNDSLLATVAISNFSQGKYLVFLMRGHVKIRITATGTGNAVLSGIFFDTEANDPPTLSLISPNAGSISLPSEIVLEVEAADADGSISRVEFFSNGVKLGERIEPPYRLVWTNALAGTNSLTAKAVDEFGAVTLSDPVIVTTTLPFANAVFLRADQVTQGNWIGVYGADGYVAADMATNLPSFVNLDSEAPESYIWNNSTTDQRALQRVGTDDRIAATWVNFESFQSEFRLTDGKNHRLTFYFLDWDNVGRALEATVFDGESGRVLDTQQITNFAGGIYYTWNVRGHLRIQIKKSLGVNAVMSAFFLDPETNTPPVVRLTQPLPGTVATVPHQLLFSVDAADDAAVSQVEFFVNKKKIGASSTPPFDFLWQALAGENTLVAKAIDNKGAATDSAAVKIFIQSTNSAAEFLGENSETQGDWKGAFGVLGYNIINDVENYPAFAELTVSEHRNLTWIYTLDVRAPLLALSPGRIAAVWVNDTNFVINLSLGDGIPRKISFYCLDWDRGGRAQTFTIRDANSGQVLDTRDITEFQEGKYLTWSLRGHVTVEISADVGNAVLSGLFFDPLFAPIELWRWLHFTSEQIIASDFSGDSADPDEDGIPNLLEYAHGLNPLVPDVEPLLKADLDQNSINIIFRRAQAATDLTFQLETSADLVTWEPADEFVNQEEIPGLTTVTVSSRLPIDPGGRQFLRLQIQRKK